MYDAVHAASAPLRCAGDVRGGRRLQAGKASPAENQEAARAAFTLELVPTRDILASLPTESGNYLVVGFAAETKELEDKRAQKAAREKLRHDRGERCQPARSRNGKRRK